MKRILILTACALALLLVLTGCNIAPSPAETTEEVTQGEVTSGEVTNGEVTTEAVTTEKKEVNTDLGDVFGNPDQTTLIWAKTWDEFLQEYENNEISKNGYFSIKSDIIAKTLAIKELPRVFKVLYREYSPESQAPGFRFEANLGYYLEEDIHYVDLEVDYDCNGRYTPLTTGVPFDESNGIYCQEWGKDILYYCLISTQLIVIFQIPEAVENHEEVRTVLLDYVAEIKEIANREVTESTP